MVISPIHRNFAFDLNINTLLRHTFAPSKCHASTPTPDASQQNTSNHHLSKSRPPEAYIRPSVSLLTDADTPPKPAEPQILVYNIHNRTIRRAPKSKTIKQKDEDPLLIMSVHNPPLLCDGRMYNIDVCYLFLFRFFPLMPKPLEACKLTFQI